MTWTSVPPLSLHLAPGLAPVARGDGGPLSCRPAHSLTHTCHSRPLAPPMRVLHRVQLLLDAERASGEVEVAHACRKDGTRAGLRKPEGGEETCKPGTEGKLSQPWGRTDVREQFSPREQRELWLQEKARCAQEADVVGSWQVREGVSCWKQNREVEGNRYAERYTRCLDLISKCSENQRKGFRQRMTTRLIEVKNREQVLWGGWFVSPGEMMGGGDGSRTWENGLRNQSEINRTH